MPANLAVDRGDFLDGLRQQDASAQARDFRGHALQQHGRTALQIAHAFVEQVAPRQGHALDAGADPRGGQVVLVLEELQREGLLPHHLVSLGADPAGDPVTSIFLVQRSPVADALGVHDVQSVADLVDQPQVREAEQRERRSPLVQLALVVVPHLGVRPVQAVGQLQVLEQLEQREIGLADEVVVTLDAQAVEIEVRRHAADAVVAFVDVDLVALFQQFHGSHQAHGAAADDRESTHGSSLV